VNVEVGVRRVDGLEEGRGEVGGRGFSEGGEEVVDVPFGFWGCCHGRHD